MKRWVSEYTRIVTPLNIIATFRGDLKNTKKSLDKTFSEMIGIFRPGKMEGLEREGEIEMLGEIVARKTLRRSGFVSKVKKEIKKAVKELLFVSSKIYSVDLKKYSNRQLIDLMNKFIKRYSSIFDYGLVTTLDGSLIKIGQEYLNNKARSDLASRYFTILTTPTKETIYRREERDLLKIAIEINKNKRTKNLFKRNAGFLRKKLLKLNPKIDKIIDKITEDYCWLLINYEGKPRTKTDFIKLIKKILKQKISPQKALENLKKKEGEIIRKQRQIEKRLKIDQKHKRLFEAIRNYAYLREYRKPQCVKALYHFRKLIKEVARRLSLTSKQVKSLLPQEIEKALLVSKVNKREIINRVKYAVLYISPKKEYILSGRKARNFVKKLYIIKKVKEKVVRGISACPGRVVGKVKIILNLKDLTKFKKDDIFVCRATSPELVSALRKAKAIVTDEGGMTSHAAIISRELSVPCIVGTKIATKAFRDRDRVEVNAIEGIIKKL